MQLFSVLDKNFLELDKPAKSRKTFSESGKSCCYALSESAIKFLQFQATPKFSTASFFRMQESSERGERAFEMLMKWRKFHESAKLLQDSKNLTVHFVSSSCCCLLRVNWSVLNATSWNTLPSCLEEEIPTYVAAQEISSCVSSSYEQSMLGSKQAISIDSDKLFIFCGMTIKKLIHFLLHHPFFTTVLLHSKIGKRHLQISESRKSPTHVMSKHETSVSHGTSGPDHMISLSTSGTQKDFSGPCNFFLDYVIFPETWQKKFAWTRRIFPSLYNFSRTGEKYFAWIRRFFLLHCNFCRDPAKCDFS
eukprot:g25779.t1